MARFDFAYVQAQGAELIIVPVDRVFGQRSDPEKNATIHELELRCRGAGLEGEVVPVWDAGGNRMAFFAPRAWHGYFQRMSLHWVLARANYTIAW